jgi:uncharacterized protein (DUF58 family)
MAKFIFLGCLGVTLYVMATTSGAGWLYVISASIVGVVIISALAPLYNVRGIEVIRRAPLVGTAGDPLSCKLEVRNTGRLPRHLLEIGDKFAGDMGGGVVERLRRGTPESFEYTIENPRRGIYSGGGVIVESATPFGLFRGKRPMRVASETTIYPRTFDVAGLPRPNSPDAAGAERNEASEMHRGLGGEFWGVREYRPGDPARLIAWRQSARSLASGRLSVIELAREMDPPLKIALNLDARAPSGAREMIVSAAASLMLHALQEGREVAADAGPQYHGFPETPDRDAILTWCAGLVASRPPVMEDASIEILPAIKYERPPRAETVVLVSCHEFAGAGPWMSPDQERTLADSMESTGRKITMLGPDVREPWRVS